MGTDTTHDNDWKCLKCGNINFSFRTVCNMRKCNTPKPGSQVSKSDKHSKQKMPEGSWKCEKCNNVNYPFRTKCNGQNCGAEKPAESTKSPSPASDQNDQCPRQTNNIDCRHYVLRFMRDIITHQQVVIPKKAGFLDGITLFLLWGRKYQRIVG